MNTLPPPALSVRGLSKKYGSVTVLENISFDVFGGEILAVVGANGAGKTTTFRLVAGLSSSSGGSMTLNGADISDHRATRQSLGALIEGPGTYGHLSAAENLRVLSWTAGRSLSRQDNGRLLELVGLSGTGRQRVSKFSTGMRQRLAVAIAMLGSPNVLILDEPTAGLDAMGILEVRQLLRELAASGLAILWSSHDLREVEDICSRLIWLHRGQLRYSGDISDLPRGSEVLEIRVADSERAISLLGEIHGVTGLAAVPGGVRVKGIPLAIVIERLTAVGLRVSDVNKITTNFEDVFAAVAEEPDGR